MGGIAEYNPDTLVKAFVQLRDNRTALKAEYEESDRKLKDKMEKLEVAMMTKLKEQKIDSFKTEHGTVYTTVVRKYSCGDWDAFWNNMLEQARPDFMEKRISAGAMNDILDSDGELPPGISYETERCVRVRRG